MATGISRHARFTRRRARATTGARILAVGPPLHFTGQSRALLVAWFSLSANCDVALARRRKTIRLARELVDRRRRRSAGAVVGTDALFTVCLLAALAGSPDPRRQSRPRLLRIRHPGLALPSGAAVYPNWRGALAPGDKGRRD